MARENIDQDRPPVAWNIFRNYHFVAREFFMGIKQFPNLLRTLPFFARHHNKMVQSEENAQIQGEHECLSLGPFINTLICLEVKKK